MSGLESAIYVGHVRHRRSKPAHQFTVPLFMMYLDLEELGDLIVARPNNQPIRLREVADITTELYPRSGFMYRTGFPAYYIAVQGKYGANTVSILDDVNRTIADLNAGPLAAEGLQVVLSFDASVHIRRAIGLVNGNLVLRCRYRSYFSGRFIPHRAPSAATYFCILLPPLRHLIRNSDVCDSKPRITFDTADAAKN